MSAAEIIDNLRRLPKGEQSGGFCVSAGRVDGEKKSFEEASEVFSEYGDLLAKLAK